MLVAVGARAAEEALLAGVEAALADGGVEALARPVRVIVPSGSLRLHVAAALARRRGRAAVGLVVQTLYAAALEALDRGGVAPRLAGAGGDLAFEVLVRRAARRQRALASRLDGLADGYGAAAATVRDLLDAGFEAAHAEAADEALAAAGGRGVPGDEIERARALVAAAVEVERDLAALGAARRSAVLRRATELLATDPDGVLPSRAVFVHGFADATGVATDLLEALVRHRAATVVVDTPPDPAPPSAGGGEASSAAEVAVEAAHGERLRERLGGAAGLAAAPVPPTPPPALARFSAAGSDTEAREVALRVRELLDGGSRPEGIAVVARDLAPHGLALRRQFVLLGVPFSGLGATGTLGAAGRRAQALLDLLRRRHDLPADRWLDAAGSLARPAGGRRRGPFVDLRLAFSSLGAGRLGDVAALDLDRALGGREWMPLPILRGLAAGRRDEEGEVEDEEERAGGTAARRTVGRGELAAAVAAAGRLVDRLASWPARAEAAEHLRRLGTLLTQELGWRSAGAAQGGEREPVFAALERLAADLPPGLTLDGEELRLVLGRALEEAGRGALGGRGGGVQVLGVVEARGRTFDHLFVVGANRNAFPRPVRQDPLLADDLRAALAPVLPDLKRKQAGFDEERHLFAELLSASPRVTVSWWSRNDDGRAVAPSPLVERLAPGEDAAVAATIHALGADRGPRPAAESATLAALHGGGRGRFRQLLATAIAESAADDRDEAGAPAAAAADSPADPAALAAARVAVLDEIDPDLRTPEGRAASATLGPYFGFVGRRGVAADPREPWLWVTQAENLAACPWQLFLERLLKLEPTPDPLQALPGTDPLLLGNVVHTVLEQVAVAAGVAAGGELAAALAAGGTAVRVAWPPADELDRLVERTARQVLLDEGIPLPGLARALAAQTRPFLERARELDWQPAGGELAVVAVEAQGEAVVEDAAGRRRRLRFKADRVDRGGGAGGLRLTDYKSGRVPAAVTGAAKLREHHLRRVGEGRSLQATAYQVAAGGGGEAASGRYLYLRPDADPRSSEVLAAGDDAAFAARFAATARAVFAAWDAGGFFPRVVDTAGERTPTRCSYCRVAEACLLGDSGARRRLFEWASGGERPTGAAEGAAEAAARGVWRLHDAAATPDATGPGEAG